jgi:ribonuclease BN (tRNA processing enzyme)
MRITLLGTNGWFDSPTGSTPCVLAQTDECDIVFDAGYGFAKLDRYISGTKPAFLFLSHFHYDHIIGLHTLAKNRFDHGLRIFGLPGIGGVMRDFFNPTLTIPLDRLSFSLSFDEMNGAGPSGLPFKITALPLIHSGPCLGYRLELDGKIFTYCTDTGYCENAVTLARGADLFIAESALPPGSESNPKWPHLTPALAAQIALEAGARRLVLVHFDASEPLETRREAARQAALVFPAAVAGQDGMTFEI